MLSKNLNNGHSLWPKTEGIWPNKAKHVVHDTRTVKGIRQFDVRPIAARLVAPASWLTFTQIRCNFSFSSPQSTIKVESIQQIVARLAEAEKTKSLDARTQLENELIGLLSKKLPGVLPMLDASGVSVAAVIEPAVGLIFSYKDASIFTGIKQDDERSLIEWFSDAPGLPFLNLDFFAKTLNMLLIQMVDDGTLTSQPTFQWAMKSVEHSPSLPEDAKARLPHSL